MDIDYSHSIVERDNAVTIAKGIAIILMVLGHSCTRTFGEHYVNLFHMPLFFFFSGFFFKDEYLHDVKSFLIRKAKGIYWPWCKWGLLFLLFHNVFFKLHIYSDCVQYQGVVSYLYGFKEFFEKGFRIVFGFHGQEQLLGGYWFLKTLFWSQFIVYITFRLTEKMKFGKELSFVLLLLFWMLVANYNFKIPFFGIGKLELLASLYMVLGKIYKTYNIKIHLKYWISPVVFLLLIPLAFVFKVGMFAVDIQTILPYLIISICGIMALYSIGTYISYSNKDFLLSSLVFIGNNTLPILTWHFLSFKMVSLLIIYLYKLPVDKLAEFPVIIDYARAQWWLLYLLFGVVVPLLLVKCKHMTINLLKTNS